MDLLNAVGKLSLSVILAGFPQYSLLHQFTFTWPLKYWIFSVSMSADIDIQRVHNYHWENTSWITSGIINNDAYKLYTLY